MGWHTSAGRVSDGTERLMPQHACLGRLLWLLAAAWDRLATGAEDRSQSGWPRRGLLACRSSSSTNGTGRFDPRASPLDTVELSRDNAGPVFTPHPPATAPVEGPMLTNVCCT